MVSGGAAVMIRRVEVMVSVARVPVIVTLGAGLVRSTVGVKVGSSRVGMGAWVGVGASVPRVGTISVTGARVAVAVWVGLANKVAVGGRCNDGRTIKLKVPAQYSTPNVITITARQPYVICWLGDKPQNPRGVNVSGCGG